VQLVGAFRCCEVELRLPISISKYLIVENLWTPIGVNLPRTFSGAASDADKFPNNHDETIDNYRYAFCRRPGLECK